MSVNPPGSEQTIRTEAPRPVPPEEPQIGPYRLLQQIGIGGMGEVWLAEQREPVRRKVALKLLKRGMDTAQVVARFDAERQALALMDHPAVAKVFDAGSTPRGQPHVVPAPRDPGTGGTLPAMDGPTPEGNCDPKQAAPTPNLSWAELIRRVFAVDVLECPRSGGRMRILAAIQTPGAIRAIFEHLGLASRAPPISPARSAHEDSGPQIFPEEPEL
jgi:hypothetical protein